MKRNSLSIFLILFLFSGVGKITSGVYDIISVKVYGEGQPMLLIHGMSSSAGVWDEVVEHYRDDYELHVLSLKGFGNAEYVEKEHYLESVKEELIRYAREADLRNPILMGHSMGGFLSLWAAADAPDLFGSVVAVDGIPYFPALAMPGTTPESAAPMITNMKNSMVNVSDEEYRGFLQQSVEGMITAEAHRQEVMQMGMASNRELNAQAMGEMYTTDLRKEVGRIEIPVLVLGSWYGYRNFGVTKELVHQGIERQVKEIERAEIAVADKALHFIFYDEPEWFYDQVSSFLSGNVQ